MLRRVIGAGVLAASFLCLPSLDAQGPAKKKGDGKPGASGPIDSAKLHSGEFVGTLKSTPGSDRSFTLTIDNKHLEPTGKGGAGRPGGGNNNVSRVLQAQQRIQQAQQRMAAARNPQQANQARQQMVQAQVQLQQAVAQMNNAALTAAAKGGDGGAPAGYRWVQNKQDIDFQTTEEVKVRINHPPETFDEKGLIKKYTPKELADLKGKDKNLPGYEAGPDKLAAGAKVKVTLAPAKKAAAKQEDKEADKDADEKRMQVRVILVLEEAPLDGGSGKGKAKGKAKAK